MTMTLVSTVTVGAGGASSIDFTSIPQTGTDLLLVVSPRSQVTGTVLTLKFNGSSTGYSDRRLFGYGSGVGSGSNYASGTEMVSGYAASSGETANTFGNNAIYIPNYSSSSTNKSVSSDGAYENNATSNFMSITAGLWSNTSAITSINLYIYGGGTFAQYSTASLYTITKGSGGATVS